MGATNRHKKQINKQTNKGKTKKELQQQTNKQTRD
jgi:hypothetical protein